MPIIRLREITGMDSKERSKKLSQLRAELSRLRTMISAGGAVENPARIRELRRAIARIMTIENQERKPAKTETQAKKSKQVKAEKVEKPSKKPAKAKTKEKKTE